MRDPTARDRAETCWRLPRPPDHTPGPPFLVEGVVDTAWVVVVVVVVDRQGGY